MRFNPFKAKPNVQKPNRNAFDMSHAVNFTSQFGKLYPILCQEVIPGDSFNIKTTFGLRLLPLMFPVQTRMRADIHFFYVRNRNLWKDWPDFIGATKDGLTPPFIYRETPAAANNIFGTGTIGDFLGVPTTVAGSLDNQFYSILNSACEPGVDYTGVFPPFQVGNNAIGWHLNLAYPTITEVNTAWNYLRLKTDYMSGTGTIENVLQTHVRYPLTGSVKSTTQMELISASGNPLPRRMYFIECSKSGVDNIDSGYLAAYTISGFTFTLSGATYRSTQFNQIKIRTVLRGNKVMNLDEYLNEQLKHKNIYIVLETLWNEEASLLNPRNDKYNHICTGIKLTNLSDVVISDITDEQSNAYCGVNPSVRISALPFRAYESIFNSFYRNQQNDPFRIDGIAEYNKFIPTSEGGSDNYPYVLYSRNWEDDFLTTALPSPQQGIAPLVGARQIGDKTYTLHADIDGEPREIRVTAGSSGELTAVSLYSKDVDESTIMALNEAIDFGISINDFRNVNSLQRWLEKNVRRGYRYRDQILSHFGVEVRYDALDMPEFLGGLSNDISINSVSQMVDTNESPLGSYAGQGYSFGTSKHAINHYFDEHGFIFAIFSVVPIPSYSQLLPKYLTKHNHLDYYSPEFAHIGLQPITLKEVSPNEVYKYESGSMNKVFGYQRPFYDYLASVDRVHGNMRTSMRDFLVNRYFERAPQLSAEFLRIDSEEINDIFTVTSDNDDKIIGQVYFDMTAKRPISRFSEGRLE